jgi:hypothetical protein
MGNCIISSIDDKHIKFGEDMLIFFETGPDTIRVTKGKLFNNSSISSLIVFPVRLMIL